MKNKICQSCGMPLAKESDFGTNEDGGKNEEYCTYCYQNGKFTWNGTLTEMMDKLVSMHDQMGLSKEEAYRMANINLPKLKRWRK